MVGRLGDKVALVTGAGSGIGRVAAEMFAREGAAIVALDVHGDLADQTAQGIAAAGGRAIAIKADVTVAAEVDAAVANAVNAFGRLDVLFNNAAIDVLGSISQGNEADWDRCLSVNVKGTFLCSRAAVPHLVTAGGGSIVNQASVAGLVGVRNLAAYSASKGAVVSLTRSMAVDLAPYRIRVNAICPGAILTPMMEKVMRERGDGDLEIGMAETLLKYPLGRLGSPEDIASLALYLASDEASFMTGSIITADGGMSAR